jgi:hypothetical protein
LTAVSDSLMKWGLAVTAVALMFAGCDASATKVATAAIRDSSGVSIVDNTDAVWDTTTQWRVEPRPMLVINEESSGTAGEFTYLRGIRRLSNGSIVVLEGSADEVRWFDANGKNVATRGGHGKGPGEFAAATDMIIAGDTVIVQDAPRIKQVLYSANGTLLREEYLDLNRYRELGKWLECVTLTLPDRSLIGCQPEAGLQSGWQDRVGMQRRFSRFRRVPWTLDTVYSLGVQAGLEQFGLKVGDRIRYSLHPYHARTYLAGGGSPIRIAIARNPEYSIEIWTPEGVLERIVRRSNAREATTPGAVSELSEAMRWMARDEALFRRIVAETPVPDSVPAVWGLAVGDEGELWVKRGRGLKSDSTVYDVFDQRGQFLGEIKMAPRSTVHQIGSGFVAVSVLDKNDVPSVNILRLARGAAKAAAVQ